MSNKKRTENGPRWESSNPGKGCNSTHVAKTRKWWKKNVNRWIRRLGHKGRFHGKNVKVPVGDEE